MNTAISIGHEKDSKIQVEMINAIVSIVESNSTEDVKIRALRTLQEYGTIRDLSFNNVTITEGKK